MIGAWPAGPNLAARLDDKKALCSRVNLVVPATASVGRARINRSNVFSQVQEQRSLWCEMEMRSGNIRGRKSVLNSNTACEHQTDREVQGQATHSRISAARRESLPSSLPIPIPGKGGAHETACRVASAAAIPVKGSASLPSGLTFAFSVKHPPDIFSRVDSLVS